MKIIYTLAVLLLMIPAFAQAEAFELNGNDLNLPVSDSGEISFKGCDNCNFERAFLTADARFRVNGTDASFDQLREALAEAPNRGKSMVAVITDDESNRVRMISVRIR